MTGAISASFWKCEFQELFDFSADQAMPNHMMYFKLNQNKAALHQLAYSKRQLRRTVDYKLGLDWSEAIRVAEDRKAWHELVKALCTSGVPQNNNNNINLFLYL